MMTINHNEANEQAKSNLLPEGDYEFSILSAEFKNSKKGNQMWDLKLAVFNPATGRKVSHRAFVGSWRWKDLEDLLDSVGQHELYKLGKVEASDLIDQTGVVHLKPGTNKESGKAELQTKYWVPLKKQKNAPVAPAPVVVDEFGADNDVPF